MGVKPKKGLGQHFLRDLDAAQKIVDGIDALNPDLVLEIGPGEGVLTERLIPKHPNLHIIEIDGESIDYLRVRFPQIAESMYYDDVLQWNFPEGDWVVIGNFPYNISTQIVFKILENRDHVRGMVGMFQKEVAERIASPAGSKVYGILSVLTQTFYDVEYLFTLNEQAFSPPPKVKSGVIRLKRKENYNLECDERFLFQLVKLAFNQRRKMLRNSLKSYLTEDNRSSVEAYLEKRPEQLHFEDFVKLSVLLKP
jgi:16S rRNA (adenine1518-N6/adenine1519-N6)-dimethyltransferase